MLHQFHYHFTTTLKHKSRIPIQFNTIWFQLLLLLHQIGFGRTSLIIMILHRNRYTKSSRPLWICQELKLLSLKLLHWVSHLVELTHKLLPEVFSLTPPHQIQHNPSVQRRRSHLRAHGHCVEPIVGDCGSRSHRTPPLRMYEPTVAVAVERRSCYLWWLGFDEGEGHGGNSWISYGSFGYRPL